LLKNKRENFTKKQHFIISTTTTVATATTTTTTITTVFIFYPHQIMSGGLACGKLKGGREIKLAFANFDKTVN